MTPSETLTLATYFFVLVILAVYGWHRYYLVYLDMKNKDKMPVPAGPMTALPVVTIQLPMYNEMYVAERIIDATCLIDYPLDKLEIQVLDDSTDTLGRHRRAGRAPKAAKGVNQVHPPHQPRRLQGRRARRGHEGRRRASSSPSSTPTSSRRHDILRTSSTTSPTTRSAWCRSAGTTSTATPRC